MPSQFPIGSRIDGQFIVKKILGEGGMGVVLGVRDADKNEFALKYCRDADETSLRRFRREVATMEDLAHPNVMPVLFANLEHDPPYFTMPLAQGSLSGERLDEEAALDAFTAVLDGVQAIHASGGTHRDLKPANIMIMLDGSFMVSDLGLAKVDPRGTTILTQTREFLGTDKYCAPEQRLPRGSREADARTDVYQLGKTLYELLTGEDAALIDYGPLPGGLAQVIRRATRERPDDRFQTVGHMRDAIEIYRESQKPDAQPVKLFESLLVEAEEQLKRSEYSAPNAAKICAVITGLHEPDNDDLVMDLFDRIPRPLIRKLAAHMTAELEPALERYSMAIDRKVGGQNFSYAESVAERMKLVFSSSKHSEMRALALKTAMIAATRLHRFSALAVVDELIGSVTDDDAYTVAEMLREQSSIFAQIVDRYSAPKLHPAIRAVWKELKA